MQSSITRKVGFRITSDGVLNREMIQRPLNELHQRLYRFVFREGTFSSWVEVVDDLHVSFPEPSIVIGTYSMTIEMRDTEYIGSSSRFNQFTMSILMNRLKEKIKFEMDGMRVEMWD